VTGAISSSSPFRLNAHTLEPGCFSPRYVPSNIDLSSFDMDNLSDESCASRTLGIVALL
jgi:hypothetical protein